MLTSVLTLGFFCKITKGGKGKEGHLGWKLDLSQSIQIHISQEKKTSEREGEGKWERGREWEVDSVR